MADRFDIVVTGAGPAGCMLALRTAQAGFRVALLDRRSDKQLGNRWEVGVERSIFSEVGLKTMTADTALEDPERTRFFAGDRDHFVEMGSQHESIMTYRHRDINRLLFRAARNAGVAWFPRFRAETLLINDLHILGVRGRQRGLLWEGARELTGRLVVDAAGVHGPLRRQVPPEYAVKRAIRLQDYATAWNEVRELPPALQDRFADHFNMKPGVSYTRVGKYHGFQTIHWRRNNTVNFIFGAAAGSRSTGARELCRRFIADNPYVGRTIHADGSLLPIRRALDTLVADGFLCVGDAACQVVPTMGSGIASSLKAAQTAAKTIIRALNSGDTRRKSLWSYNAFYQKNRGAILAGYDIVRRFLQSLDQEQINDVFKSGLLKEKDFMSTFSSNSIEYNFSSVLDSLRHLFAHFRSLMPIAVKFVQMVGDSQKAQRLYADYPAEWDAALFERWQDRTNHLFAMYRTLPSGSAEEFL